MTPASSITLPTQKPSQWQFWLALTFCWIIILYTFRESVLLVVESWDKPSHTHGYIALASTVYFLWKNRRFVDVNSCSPSLLGVIAFLLSSMAALVGELVSAMVIVQFSVVFLLISTVWAVTGYQAFRTLTVPLGFLFFAIPFGQDILPILMDWTANATVVGLRASGIPVLQQDRSFVIPSGSWSVVEACSGIRYLITSLFIGAMFAYISYQRWSKRLIFIGTLLLFALFANWLRAYTIVMIAHLTNNQWGLGMSHYAFGWIIFGVVIFITFFIGSYWRDPDPEAIEVSVGPPPPVLHMIMATALIAAMAIGTPLASEFLTHRAATDDGSAAINLNPDLGLLEKAEPQLPAIAPTLVGTKKIYRQTYRLAEAELLLQIGYYRHQSQGEELINVNNKLEPTDTWNWAGHRRLQFPEAAVKSLQAEKYVKSGTIVLATKLYWIGGFVTQNDAFSKLLQALNILIGKGDDAAAIIMTASGATEEEAKLALEAFIREHLSNILQDLDKTMQQLNQPH